MWLFKVNFHPCAIFEKVVNKGLSKCQHRCLLTLLKNPKSVLLTSGKCRFLAKENTKRKRDFYWGVSSSSEEALSRPQLSFEAVKAKRKAAAKVAFFLNLGLCGDHGGRRLQYWSQYDSNNGIRFCSGKYNVSIIRWQWGEISVYQFFPSKFFSRYCLKKGLRLNNEWRKTLQVVVLSSIFLLVTMRIKTVFRSKILDTF